MKKIIDNKQVDITHDEYELYKRICESYDRPNFEGKELFKEHFEVNAHGIITMVKPPQGKYTTMEVHAFLLSLAQNQHLRLMHEQLNMFVKEASQRIIEVFEENEKLRNELTKYKK